MDQPKILALKLALRYWDDLLGKAGQTIDESNHVVKMWVECSMLLKEEMVK